MSGRPPPGRGRGLFNRFNSPLANTPNPFQQPSHIYGQQHQHYGQQPHGQQYPHHQQHSPQIQQQWNPHYYGHYQQHDARQPRRLDHRLPAPTHQQVDLNHQQVHNRGAVIRPRVPPHVQHAHQDSPRLINQYGQHRGGIPVSPCSPHAGSNVAACPNPMQPVHSSLNPFNNQASFVLPYASPPSSYNDPFRFGLLSPASRPVVISPADLCGKQNLQQGVSDPAQNENLVSRRDPHANQLLHQPTFRHAPSGEARTQGTKHPTSLVNTGQTRSFQHQDHELSTFAFQHQQQIDQRLYPQREDQHCLPRRLNSPEEEQQQQHQRKQRLYPQREDQHCLPRRLNSPEEEQQQQHQRKQRLYPQREDQHCLPRRLNSPEEEQQQQQQQREQRLFPQREDQHCLLRRLNSPEEEKQQQQQREQYLAEQGQRQLQRLAGLSEHDHHIQQQEIQAALAHEGGPSRGYELQDIRHDASASILRDPHSEAKAPPLSKDVTGSRSRGRNKQKCGGKNGNLGTNPVGAPNTNKKGKSKDTGFQKGELQEKMRQYILNKFPDMHHQAYTVPPLRILTSLNYRQIDKLSTNSHDVKEQKWMQDAALRGYQTEDTVTGWVAGIIEMLDEPIFHLTNYQFHDYLFHLSQQSSGNLSDDKTSRSVSQTNSQEINTEDPMLQRLSSSSSGITSPTDMDPTLPETDHLPDHSIVDASSSTQTVVSKTSPHSQCPFPTTLDLNVNLNRGDFDDLLISPRYGFVVIEAKTLRGAEAENGWTQTDVKGSELIKKNQETIQQGSELSLQEKARQLETSFEDLRGSELIKKYQDTTQQGSELSLQEKARQLETSSERDDPERSENNNTSKPEKPQHDDDVSIMRGTTFHPSDHETNAQKNLKTAQNTLEKNTHIYKADASPEENNTQSEDILFIESQSKEHLPRRHPTSDPLSTEYQCKDSQPKDLQSQSEEQTHSMEYQFKDSHQKDSQFKEQEAQEESQEAHSPNFMLPSSPSRKQPSSSTGNQDAAFREKIRKSFDQLQKAETVLRHMTSDLVTDPPITKVLALPNTSAADLRRLLEEPSLGQYCCSVLETQTLEEALSQCITSDLITSQRRYQTAQQHKSRQETSAREATREQPSQGLQWWRALVAGIPGRRKTQVVEGDSTVTTGDTDRDGKEEERRKKAEEDGNVVFSADVFEEIISRFCGPYSRVPSRTVADCVHLAGVAFGKSILRGDQLQVLEANTPFLFISGPPGSGKTLILGLKAAEWTMKGHEVVVLCSKGVNTGSLVSWTLYDRVLETVRQHKLKEARKRSLSVSSEDEKAADKIKPQGQGGKGKSQSKGKADKTGEKTIAESEESLKVSAEDASQTSISTCSMSTSQPKGKAGTTGKKTIAESEESLKVSAEDASQASISTCSMSTSALNSDPKENVQPGACGVGSPSSDKSSPGYSARVDFGDITVNNLHREFITANTDMESFVHQLLAKYKGRKLRIIVDECLDKRDEEFLFEKCSDAQNYLKKMETLYNEIINLVRVPKNDAQPCLHSQQKSTPGAGKSRDVNLRRQRDGRSREDGKKTWSTGVEREEKDSNVFTKLWAPEGFFPTMEHRKKKMHDRFQMLRDATSGGPPIMRSAKWRKVLDSLWATFETVKKLNTEAACGIRELPASFACGDTDFVLDKLKELDDLMVKVMGDLFLAYNSINSLQLFQFFAVITASARDTNSSLQQHALPEAQNVTQSSNLSEQNFPSASQKQSVPQGKRVSEQNFPFASQKQGVPQAKSVSEQHDLPSGQDQSFEQTEGVSKVKAKEELDNHSLSVWAASIFQGHNPDGFERVALTECIRCPPTVQRILQWTATNVKLSGEYKYITRGCDVNPPLPSDGPPVTWLDHAPHMTSHKEVNDCPLCGQALVDHLLHNLGIRTTADEMRVKVKKRKVEDKQSQLYLHDVIICGSPIHQPDCAFVKKLTAGGITLQYESQDLTEPPPYIDKAFVVGGGVAQGLEAKIVVFVPEIKRITKEERKTWKTSSAIPRHSSAGTPSRPGGSDHGQCQDWNKQHGLGQGQSQTQGQAQSQAQGEAEGQDGNQCRDWNKQHDRGQGQSRTQGQAQSQAQGETEGQDGSQGHTQKYGNDEGQGHCQRQGQAENQVPNNDKQMSGMAVSAGYVSELAGAGAYRSAGNDRDVMEQGRLRDLGAWNRQYIWNVASRSVSHFVIFHV